MRDIMNLSGCGKSLYDEREPVTVLPTSARITDRYPEIAKTTTAVSRWTVLRSQKS